MSAYQKAVESGLTTAIKPGTVPPRQFTDAEIVAILNAMTVSNIPVKSVRTWFREQELWMERSDGTMFGPLQAAYAAAPQQAKDGLDYLYDTVFAGSAEFLRTTDPVWAHRVKALVDLVVQLSPQTSGLVDSFYALDGGRPYKDLTVEQFQASRAAAALQDHLASVISRCEAAAEAAREAARAQGATTESITAAAEAAFEVV